MALNHINQISQGGEDRVLFETFTQTNDVNPESGKAGIRCHGWFTALFLRIFGKIVDITAEDGTVYRLNKNSYNKWRERHAAELKLKKGNQEELPSIEEIIAGRKEVIKQQGNAATSIQKMARGFIARKKFKELKSAVVIQSQVRGFLARKNFAKLKEIKQEIGQLKAELDHMKKRQDELELLMQDSEKIKQSLGQKKDKIQELEGKKKIAEDALVQKQQDLAKMVQEAHEKKDNKVTAFFKNIGKKDEDKQKEAEAKASEKAKIKEAKESVETLKGEIEILKESIKDLNVQIPGLETMHAELLEKMPEIKKELEELEAAIPGKEEVLAGKNKKFDALLVAMNGGPAATASIPGEKQPSKLAAKSELFDEGPTIISGEASTTAEVYTPTSESDPMGTEKGIPPKAVAEDVPKPAVNHVQNMIADVTANAHPELAKVMQAIVDKFGPAVIKSWEFDAASGKFTLSLTKPCKLWVSPKMDDGKADTKTPQGVVLLFGNNKEMEISGALDSKKSTIFLAKGFETYCKYKKWIKSGTADGKVQQIEYDPKKQLVTIHATGTDRDWKMSGAESDTKKLSTLLSDWKNGVIPANEDHEAYLAAQPAI